MNIYKNIIFSVLSVFLFFLYFGNVVFAIQLHPVSWSLPGINIISREEWGVDNKLLFSDNGGYTAILNKLNTNKKKLEELKNNDFDAWLKKKEEIYWANKSEEQKNNFLLENFKSQFNIDYSIGKLFDKELWWPWSYHDDKVAIIIHHTADYGDITKMNGKSEIEMMQKIFKYHTITRGWGDIGYNFVIGPSGKIYEGRAGGPGIIGAHAKYNNSFTLGIALMGNFNIQEPTKAQLDSLKKLTTELSYKYNIDPYTKITFHRESKNSLLDNPINFSIIGHKDAGWTSCPGKNLYSRLGEIRKYVVDNLKNRPKNKTDNVKIGFKKTQKKDFFSKDFASLYKNILKRKYIIKHKFRSASNLSIKPLISVDKIKELENKNVNVLLRELSIDYKNWDIQCENLCNIYIKGKKLKTTLKTIKLRKTSNYIIWSLGKYKLPLKNILIKDTKGGNITFINYNRKSYFGIPRNKFKGSIKIEKDKIYDCVLKKNKDCNKKIYNTFLVKNILSIDKYLRGIVETNDTEEFEKNKVMALLTKNYILYYVDKSNIHPNIPIEANYNSIDDPDYFQKYVGAGLDNTLKKWKYALYLTKGQYILFEEGVGTIKKKKLAFTPYFNCSPGFTRDAMTKFGWTNLPYLSSRLDFVKCDNFKGHGVGLSGKGANVLAKRGMNYIDIIKYYYPGVFIEKL